MTKRRKDNGVVTIEMVAAEAGVSKTTVSFVLNNNPTISEKTRRKVLDIVSRLGYQPNFNARNLSSRKNKTICVIVPELGHIFDEPYFGRALAGIYDEIEASDYRITLRKASLEFAAKKEYLNLFRRSEIAGMIYVGSTLDDYYLVDIAETDFPFIFMNNYFDGVNISYVNADAEKAGYLATKYLIELGHRKIAHVSGSPNTITARGNCAGYRRALREAGIPYNSQLETGDTFSAEIAAESAIKLIERFCDISAIFVANDIMAYSVIEALQRSGRRIPEDISVIGGDSVDFSRLISPPLTSVDIKVFETARSAAKMLFELIENRDKGNFKKKIIEPELIIRASCRKR